MSGYGRRWRSKDEYDQNSLHEIIKILFKKMVFYLLKDFFIVSLTNTLCGSHSKNKGKIQTSIPFVTVFTRHSV